MKIRILFLFLFYSCTTTTDMYRAIEFRQFPYTATEERKNELLRNAKKIKIGMDIITVFNILGHPDEIRFSYEPRIINAKKVGYTYWYILQQKSNIIKEGDQEIRISVSLNFEVTGIYFFGLEQEKEAE